MHIHLIGPGCAGKSTLAAALAEQLDLACIDLDLEYLKISDIVGDINQYGYDQYVQNNIDRYCHLIAANPEAIIATSSGFMLYASGTHPAIASIHQTILSSPGTILVMASFDFDECVKMTIERQLLRHYESKCPETHRAKISERFPLYIEMGSIKVESNQPVAAMVAEIIPQLGK